MDSELQTRMEAALDSAALGFSAKLEILRIDLRTLLRVLWKESSGPDCAECGSPLIPMEETIRAGMPWMCSTPWCSLWLQQQSSL